MGKIIEVTCSACGKKFMMDEWHYKYRMERNQGKGVYCSVKCGHQNSVVTEEQARKISESLKKSYESGDREYSQIHHVKCATCGKDMELKQWEYNSRMAVNKGRGFFCSRECEHAGREELSKETKKKISESQKGVSVPTRGRPGHIVTEEMRRKISETKRANNKHVVSDWEIVKKAAKDEGLTNYVTTQAPVPDNIFVDGCTCGRGRVAAMEVEKKPHFTAVQKKMDAYRMNTPYGKVILRWYNLQGKFQKRWVYENGDWSELI